MARELKFRYRYTDGKSWIMKVFTLAEVCNGEPFEVLSDQPLLRGYKHVGEDQYTGLTDCNGVEVYEGDVSLSHGVCTFLAAGIEDTPGFYWLDPHSEYPYEPHHMGYLTTPIKVIGNIWQNPDLLGEAGK
jgi:hypothetical protein